MRVCRILTAKISSALTTLAVLSLSLLFYAYPVFATTGSNTLTIVSETGYNSMAVTITPSGFSASTKKSTLTGTIDAQIVANPTNAATTALTLSGNNLSMSNISFSWLFGIITLQMQGMGGYASTLTPPAPVTPNSNGGTFVGSLHTLVINRGTVTGSAGFNFATSPARVVGAGTGAITMGAGTGTATHTNFPISIVIPVDSTTTITGAVPATVRIQGTVKASGTITLPLNEFIAWADNYNLGNARFTAPVAAGAAPLGLAWATGMEPTTPLTDITPSVQAGPPSITATITLPGTGTRALLWVESTTDLVKGLWLAVAAANVSTGANPLPVGTSGTVTIQLGTGSRLFIRLRATEP
jgi:hypothetical protein